MSLWCPNIDWGIFTICANKFFLTLNFLCFTHFFITVDGYNMECSWRLVYYQVSMISFKNGNRTQVQLLHVTHQSNFCLSLHHIKCVHTYMLLVWDTDLVPTPLFCYILTVAHGQLLLWPKSLLIVHGHLISTLTVTCSTNFNWSG